MSITGRLVRELRAVSQWGDSTIPPNSWVGGGGSSALSSQGVLSISTVLACVKVLCNDVSILPFSAYEGDKHSVKQVTKQQPQIVTSPFGPDMAPKVGMKQIVASLGLRGRAFMYVVASDSFGNPTQLQVLNPDTVQVKRDPRKGKQFTINGSSYGPDEVKHIVGLSMPGDIDGIDPVTYMRNTFTLAADRVAYGQAFYRNGTTPSGVISVPGQGDRKKAREVKEAWEAGHAGVANSHRPAVVFGGATWTQLSVNPEQAQFLATGQFLREEICGWFGVPLQRVMATPNGSPAAGKGLDTIDQGYATHTMLPITIAIEDIWDTFIPGGLSSWTQFDYRGLLRANAMERAQIAQIDRLIGRRNRDELRADEGWSRIGGPDGTDFNIPFNTNSAVPPLAGVNPDGSPIITPDDGGTT